MLAPAKINLMLSVIGKREDGYHLLQSMVMFADIGDDVTLTPSPEFSVKAEGEFASSIEGDNLIVKAANALAAAHNTAPSGSITLVKNLPVGAGLGGGSSDAAVALSLMAEDWNLTIPSALPRTLGSDVPACLTAKPCWMEGTGESITPLAIDFDIPVLLVNPRVPLATIAVYQRLSPPYSESLILPDRFIGQAELITFLKRTHNALEAPAIELAPVISDVLETIETLPGAGLSRMSGSGATCFGLFTTEEECQNAADALIKSRPDWWIKYAVLRGSHG